MYNTDFTTEIARQHREDLIREATASRARRSVRAAEKARRAKYARSFTWATLKTWQLSH